jgi:hypothetical protein
LLKNIMLHWVVFFFCNFDAIEFLLRFMLRF